MAVTTVGLGSMGRAWLASALLHGSIAAALIVHSELPSSPPATELIEIQSALEVPPLLPPPATPAPEPLPLVAPPPLSKLPPAPAMRSARAVVTESRTVEPTLAEPGGDVPTVVATTAGSPTFVMALAVGSSLNATAASPSTLEVVDEKGVSSRAQVAYGPVPVYPRAARAAQIETDVPVEIIVNQSGYVIDARVMSHLGYGLEEATLDAVRRYRFTPAQRDGHAVAVRMMWTMQYRLQ